MANPNSSLSMVVAYSNGRVIGADGTLPWPERSIPSDMQRFRDKTRAKTVIMGTNTFESLERPDGLPGRENIVITRQNRNFGAKILVAHSIAEALDMATREPVVIGGSMIYELAMPHATEIFVTEVLAEFEGDTRFPELGSEWKEVKGSREDIDIQHTDDQYPLRFITYKKTA